jgi:hypothetical protein
MRTVIVVAFVCLASLAVAGCSADYGALDQQSEVDQRLVTWPCDAAIQSALVSQHTLFPYHFVDDSPLLNELGKKDLAVLATHFKEHSGQLSVRKGQASDQLYAARVGEVLKNLEEAEIHKDNVTIADELAGGEGLPSERVLRLMSKDDKDKQSGIYEVKPASGGGSQGMEKQ